MAASEQKIPAGMGMMFKALGVDPNVIMQVAGAVGVIAQKLDTIEKNQKKIIAMLEGKNAGTGHESV